MPISDGGKTAVERHYCAAIDVIEPKYLFFIDVGRARRERIRKRELIEETK